MKSYLLIIVSIWMMVAAGCGRTHDARLMQLDAALWRNPDSVYNVSNEIDSASLNRSDRAFLRLLRAEAADKSYKTDTTSSTIAALEDYYIAENREKELHPRVNYILGRIHVEKGKIPKALEYFRQALRSADEEKTDPKLMMAINGQMTQIFSNNKLYRHGIKYSKDMVRFAERIGDPLLIARSNLHLAVEYRGLNFPDSASLIYKKVAPLFAEMGDPVQTTVYATQVASFYKELGEYAKADSVLKVNEIATDPQSQSSVESIIIDLEEKLGKSEDVEQRYLDLLSKSDNIYARKTAARQLARINFDRGDGKAGFEYAERFGLISDTISELEAASTVAELDELYSQSELHEKNIELENGEKLLWRGIFIGVTVVILLASLLTIRSYRKENLYLKRMRDLEKEMEENAARLEEASRELEYRKRQLAENKMEIEQKIIELNDTRRMLEANRRKLEENRDELIRNRESLTAIEEKLKSAEKDRDENMRKLNIVNSSLDEIAFRKEFIQKNIHGANEDEKMRLQGFIKALDPEFYRTIVGMNLKERDFYDALLIRLDVGPTEAGNVLRVKPTAVKMKRLRLWRNLPAEEREGTTGWEDYIRRFSLISRDRHISTDQTS